MLFIYLYVHVCFVCVVYWVREDVHICACMHEGQAFSSDISLYISPIYFWGQVSLFLLDYHRTPEICLSLPTPSTGVPNMCHLIATLHRCWESEALRFEWQVLYWLLSPRPSFLYVIMTNIVFFMAEFVGRTFNFVSETSVSTLSASSHPPKHIRLSEPLFLIFRRNLGADVETTYEETVKGSSPNQTPISYSLLL